MSKLEIHPEHEHNDPGGQQVGVLASILAVLLAVVSIASHRTHTAAIMHKSTANDSWAYYQAERIKYYVLDVGSKQLEITGAKGAAADQMAANYAKDKKRYEDEAKDVQSKARKADELAEADEYRAVRYDIGEGLLEIGLVLTSLFFIARRKFFPVIGLISGIGGSAVALSGLLL
jgi:hypothetical protein